MCCRMEVLIMEIESRLFMQLMGDLFEIEFGLRWPIVVVMMAHFAISGLW